MDCNYFFYFQGHGSPYGSTLYTKIKSFMEQNTTSSLFELHVDQIAGSYLKETARWAKFLAILGFILSGLMLLAGLFAGTLISAAFSTFGPSRAGMMGGGFVTILYIGIALINFFPCLYLFNFASKMQVALRSNDQELLNVSFKNLKSCYRFVGILMVIYLSLCALGVIFMIIGLASR